MKLSSISTYFLYIFIPLHLLSIGFFFFLSELKPINLIYIALVYFFIGGLGLELGFHRMSSHKNFRLKLDFGEKLLLLLGSLSCQGSPMAWIALHRNHHAHVDTKDDYQSPLHGLWSSYIGWTVEANLTKKIKISLIKDLLRSKFHLFIDKNYYLFVWSINLFIFILSPRIYFTIYLPGILLSFHVSSVNNLIGHNMKIGKRPFAVNDWSTDVWWAALFSWGISFQNTHHYNPNELNYGKYSGLDPAYYIFRLIKLLGLVKAAE